MDTNAWDRLAETVRQLREEVLRDSTSTLTLRLLAEANACDSRICLWVFRMRSGRALLCVRASSVLPYQVHKLCDIVEVVEEGQVIVLKDRDGTGGSGFGAYEDIPMVVDEEERLTMWERLSGVDFAV